MMKYIDKFLDTYNKRVFVLYIICMVIFIFLGYNAISLGLQLLRVQNVSGLFDLTEITSVYYTLFGRTVLGYLRFASLPYGIVKMLVYIPSIWHIFLLVFCVLIFTSGKTNELNTKAKKHLLIIIIVQVLILFAMGIGLTIVLQSGTTQMAVETIRLMGVGYFIIQCGLLLVNIIAPFVLVNNHSFES